MKLQQILIGFYFWQHRMQLLMGQLVAWGTLGLVLVTALVVILRYGLSTGSIALQESTLYLHAVVFMLGISYTYNQDRHVRVDVFYAQCSEKKRLWINFLGNLFLALPTMGFILWVGWDYVSASWIIQERSTEASGLGYIYLLKTLIILMPIFMILQILGHMVYQGFALFQPETVTQLNAAVKKQEENHREAAL